MINVVGKTIGQMVLEDARVLDVFYRYGFDFCSGSDNLLSEECNKKGIDMNNLLQEIEQQYIYGSYMEKDSITEMVDYMVSVHQDCIYVLFPSLHLMAQKIATKHGDIASETQELIDCLFELESDFQNHMMQEERNLFHYVKNIQQQVESGLRATPLPLGSISNFIHTSSVEHHQISQLLEKLRQMSILMSLYDKQCVTMKQFLEKLDELVKNMMVHIHIENNILFKKAQELERLAFNKTK